MNLDVLLVTPPSRVEVYQGLSRDLAALEPPVWSGLIAQYMEDRGYAVEMLDAEAEGLTHRETADRIALADPVLTVFMVYGQQPSASTQCMPGASKVGRLLAEQTGGRLATLLVGTHASALPGRSLCEEPFSHLCSGEGPRTVEGLVGALRGELDIDEVPDLWHLRDGQAVSNAPAGRIADLDRELPRQAWHRLPMDRYRAHNWHCFQDLDSRGSYASVQTSLGCPYRCTFCCINAPFGGAGIRYWSSEVIIAQIDHLVECYGVRNIKIPDELFVLNRKHVLGICDAIIERGYELNLWAYARVDTIQDSVLEKLKQAGVNWLGIGVESGSRYVRDGVAKGRFGEEDIVDSIRKVRAHGICVGANYIFGLPDDTPETMQATLDLALELNTEWANFYCAMAYPGSELYGIAKKRGWRLPDDPGGPGWIGYSQHARDALPLPTETLESGEVLRFRDAAFHAYFTSGSYLSMIRSRFGTRVVEHIREMTSRELPRRHHDEGPRSQQAETR